MSYWTVTPCADAMGALPHCGWDNPPGSPGRNEGSSGLDVLAGELPLSGCASSGPSNSTQVQRHERGSPTRSVADASASNVWPRAADTSGFEPDAHAREDARRPQCADPRPFGGFHAQSNVAGGRCQPGMSRVPVPMHRRFLPSQAVHDDSSRPEADDFSAGCRLARRRPWALQLSFRLWLAWKCNQ